MYPKLSYEQILHQLYEINEEEVKELHLSSKNDATEDMIPTMTVHDGKDIFHWLKVRYGQNKLRKVLLHNYDSTCALCKISEPTLLITSHIKPWAKCNREEKIDPENSILLCKLHDALFEQGFISISKSYEVLFSDNFNFEKQGISTNLFFRKPKANPPNQRYLQYHWNSHGYS